MANISDYPAEVIRAECEARLQPFDMLPKQVRDYIKVSPFGAGTELLWDFVDLHREGHSPGYIIAYLQKLETEAREKHYKAIENVIKQEEHREASRRKQLLRRYGN